MPHFQKAELLNSVKISNSFLLSFFDFMACYITNFDIINLLFKNTRSLSLNMLLNKVIVRFQTEFSSEFTFPLKLSAILPYPKVSESATEKQWCFMNTFT